MMSTKFASAFWAVINFLQTYNGAVTAVATVWIGVFTCVLAYVTRKQMVLTRKAIDLARSEFTATHRPKLVVRELLMLPGHDTRPVEIRYVVANVGICQAEIVESWIEAQHSPDGTLRPLQPSEGANPIGNEVIIAGRHIIREHGSTISYASLIVEQMAAQRTGHAMTEPRLYFRGFIIYADENGVRRRTGFCRSFDPVTKRFRIIQDPDYEYAD